jgi:tetratricopeptide (TPR) repeat protein
MDKNFFWESGQQQNYYKSNVLKITLNSKSDKSDRHDGYLRSYAFKLAQKGDYTNAIALLNQLIARHPHSAIDYNNRGLLYFQCGQVQKAFCDYNKAVRLNPKLASAYNNRANCYAARGELIAAIADYQKALDLNPCYVRAWLNQGITWRELGEYEKAIDNLEVALLFQQLEGHIFAARGRTYHLWGDWNCASADYYRALALLPLSYAQKRSQVKSWLQELSFCAFSV